MTYRAGNPPFSGSPGDTVLWTHNELVRVGNSFLLAEQTLADLQSQIDAIGGGGGIADAPSDGNDYWRNNAAWVVGNWASLDGKPATFPPDPHAHPVFTASVNGFVPAPVTPQGYVLNDGGAWVPRIIGASGAVEANFRWDTTIAASPPVADPGAGDIQCNNADPNLATWLAVSDETTNGVPILQFWGSLRAGDFVMIVKNAGPDGGKVYKLTGTPTINGVAPNQWANIPVESPVYATTGAAFANNGAINVGLIYNPDSRVPTGGNTGQFLIKTSALDYAAAWGTIVSQIEVYGGAALNSVAIVNADVGNTPIYNWRHGGLTRVQMRLDFATGDFQMRINNAAGGASRHAITTFYGGAVCLHYADSTLDNVKLATTATGISVTGEVAAATGVYSGVLSAAGATFTGIVSVSGANLNVDKRGGGGTAAVLLYADPGQNTLFQGLDGPVPLVPRWQIQRVGSADEVRITMLDAGGLNGRNGFVMKYGGAITLKYDNTDRFNTTISGSNTAGVHTQTPHFVNNVAEGSVTQINDNAKTFIANSNALRAAVTFAFPLVPVDRQDLTICTGPFGYTAVTLTVGGATTILAPITTLPAGAFASWHYRLATATWYRTG